MVSARTSAHDGEMARLLVFLTRPHHLSDDEVETWTRGEARRLLAVEGVERLELTRLQSASERHARPWDWMLELYLAPYADPRDWVDAGPCAEWIGDLRLLGLRPAVLVAAVTDTMRRMDY